jgi:hypothetical protein
MRLLSTRIANFVIGQRSKRCWFDQFRRFKRFTPLMLRDFKRSITANPCAKTQTLRALPELKLRKELRFKCVELSIA